MAIRTHNLGYPRIGRQRELKKAIEAYWSGTTTREVLERVGKTLRRQNWLRQQQAGVDLIPSNDFSLYDQVLDATALVGAIPARFEWDGRYISPETYFHAARGVKPGSSEEEHTHALEMTKWFDTNYHYLVPELERDQRFSLSSTKPFDEFKEALHLGIRTTPVLLGPITFLLLSKTTQPFDPLDLLDRLVPVYEDILGALEQLGADTVQIDEPILALDLTEHQRAAFKSAYSSLRSSAGGLSLLLNTYFGGLHDNLTTALALPVDILHIDCVAAPEDIDRILTLLPSPISLSLGVVDGRNVWKNDYDQSAALLRKALHLIGSERLLISPSCSLQHCPLSLDDETEIEPSLRNWLSFASEKLDELRDLVKVLGPHHGEVEKILAANRQASLSRRTSPALNVSAVRTRCASVSANDTKRKSTYEKRKLAQQERWKLPPLPTTTIGSFPQTREVRKQRAAYKKGAINKSNYDAFLRDQTKCVVLTQEQLGLDVLVHGEFERNDMVEYFGEHLEGFAFTKNGWVQSYGTRCVKPPIIFADVYRPAPITLDWSTYAQSLTKKPVKGMLTGPITILQWSFVRNDQPNSETARQIALAIRDEVHDLEHAGIGIIQIDEPALREGLPLRQSDWSTYLRWAIDAFKLCSSGVQDETQIHTHMCYAEFNEIIEAIALLDADVISIEASRSKMDLLRAFEQFNYPNEIGPGVWDIHSPRVPPESEIGDLIARATSALPAERIWVNPDCGLKTRDYEEVIASLRNMVRAAGRARDALAVSALA